MNCNKLNTELKDTFVSYLSMDQEFCQNGQDLLKNIFKSNKYLTTKHKQAIQNNIFIAGSLGEGGTIARIFYQNQKFPDQPNKEIEADIEYIVLGLNEEYKNYIEDLKHGYVKLRVDEKIVGESRKIGWNVDDIDITEIVQNIRSSEGFLQPYKLKSEMQKRVKSTENTNKDVQLALSIGLNKKMTDVEVEHSSENVTKAGVYSEYLVKVDGQPFVHVSIDMIALVKLEWWPSVGDQWKNRTRNWPSPDIIEQLTTTGYIIAKPKDKHNFETVQLRYSFSHIERELVNMRNEQQHLIYFIFKCMFYKWIKPIPSQVLSSLNEEFELESFVVKNVMLWACEEFPPEDQLWDDGNTLGALYHLFEQLIRAFEGRFMKYYFIEDVNILHEIPHEVKDEVCKMVRIILSDMGMFLNFVAEFDHKFIGVISMIAKETAQLLDAVRNEDYKALIDVVMKRPHLIEESLNFFFRKIRKKTPEGFLKNVNKMSQNE